MNGSSEPRNRSASAEIAFTGQLSRSQEVRRRMRAHGGKHRVEEIAAGFSFLESPRWRAGALYLSDFYSGRVLRLRSTGFDTVCTLEGQPSGLGFARDGTLLIVSMLDHRLLAWRDDRLLPVAEFGELCEGPANDMVVDASGRAYIGNFGSTDPLSATVLVRCDPDGSTEVAAKDLIFPNGGAITSDGRTLIVAESYAARVSAWDIDSNGGLARRRVWAQFGEEPDYLDIDRGNRELAVVPDGICLNAAGQLWVADAAGYGVWCIAEGGVVVDFIDTAPYATYAVALGGSDGRTLFICGAPPDGTFDPEREHRSVLLSAAVEIPAAAAPHAPRLAAGAESSCTRQNPEEIPIVRSTSTGVGSCAGKNNAKETSRD